MDNTINSTIIEKVIIKSVAIYKGMDMLSQPPFEDKFKKETLCQQNENTQKQNSEKCLNKPEKRIEQPQNVDTNETKIVNEQENWRTITGPKFNRKLWMNNYNKIYYKANKNKIKVQTKEYYKNNKDKVKVRTKVYVETNKDKIKLRKKAYVEANKDKIKLQQKLKYAKYKDNYNVKQKIYNEVNKDKIKVYKNDYDLKRRKTDPNYKLRKSLRSRLYKAIEGKYKAGSAVRDLGCTIEEFKVYLESKFQPGMSWDNWTTDGWHIDHIKPLSSFDLSDRNQLLEACHYTNLQPLWAKDNLSKNDNII